MKIDILKTTLKFLVMAIIAGSVFVSCKDDDDDPDPIIILDGFYLKTSDATDADLNSDTRLKVTRNEVTQEERSSLYEIFMALEGGTTFNIAEVSGSDRFNHGPAGDFALVPEAELDIEEPKDGLWKGGLEVSTAMFSVPEDGLYHVMLDSEIDKLAIARVNWGLIGGATPGGWTDDTPMTTTFSTDKMDFVVEDVAMLVNQYKFRYSGGWKIILDPDFDLGGGETGVKVNTNFGGTLAELVPGGDNMENAEYAEYKATMTWEFGEGHSAVMEKTGDLEPLPEYPDNLYMIGGALNLEDSDNNETPDGWQWELTNVPMIPVNSHDNAFWRIVWLEASEGFKFSPVRDWVGDFGAADGTLPGVGDHLIGSNNVPAPTVAGYYMVWVDLEKDSISVTVPDVYLTGATTPGGDNPALPENRFTVDNANEVITITKDLTAGNIRMHVWHKWHYEWWQHEFNVINGLIEYRGTGGDQVAVPVPGGSTTVELDFRDGTGSIQ